MKKILFIIFMFLNFTACFYQKPLLVSPQSHEIVMGTSADYPPFEFRKNGDIVGIDIDIAREISSRLGYSLKIQDMDFASLVPSLYGGQVDFVMAGMTATEDRKKSVLFSAPYYFSHISLVARKKFPCSTDGDLIGKKLGVQLGSTMEEYGKEKSKEVEGLKTVSLTKNSILVEELKAGRIDAILIETAQAKAFVKGYPQLTSTEISSWKQPLKHGYAIAFPMQSKNSEKNVATKTKFEAFETILAQLRKDGTLDKITQKWLGSSDE